MFLQVFMYKTCKKRRLDFLGNLIVKNMRNIEK